MKNALKKKSVKIQILIYNTILFALVVLNIVLVRGFSVEFFFATDYFLMGIGFICLLIAWVGGNSVANKYRRKTKNWAESLPEDIKSKVWEIRTPWLISFVGTIIATIVYYIALG